MSSVTDRQWIKWARENPYYGVLGVETAAVATPEIKARFFETGAADFGRALGDVEAMLGPVERGAALDFGCGVGRILKPMSEQFTTAWGVDVAAEMLDMARDNCAGATSLEGRGIHLTQSVSDVAKSGAKLDFVHSYIVLQHIRPVQGIPIIVDLIKLLKPGGRFALHLTIGDSRAAIRRLNYLRYRIKPLHWAYNLKTGRPWNEAITEMNRYNLAEVLGATGSLCETRMAFRYLDQAGPVGIVLMGTRKE